jgi:hypothetical protein
MAINKLILLLFLLIGQLLYAGRPIEYQERHYTNWAKKRTHESSHVPLYTIPLYDVDSSLKVEYPIAMRSVKVVAKSFLKIGAWYRLKRAYNRKNASAHACAQDLFKKLKEDTVYTYVIANNKLRFTESTRAPKQEIYKDKFSKHYIISSLSNKVRYAGEMLMHKNPTTGHAFLVFDNGSGTYKPEAGAQSEQLTALKELLDKNLNGKTTKHSVITESDRKFCQNDIKIFTTSFDRKIDKEFMFSFDEEFVN